VAKSAKVRQQACSVNFFGKKMDQRILSLYLLGENCYCRSLNSVKNKLDLKIANLQIATIAEGPQI
jgi:hypothetical protein